MEIFGRDISKYTDKALVEAIQALQEEQRRRRHEKDMKLIQEFKQAAQALFDANIMVHIDYQNEPIYLDSTENFYFD